VYQRPASWVSFSILTNGSLDDGMDEREGNFRTCLELADNISGRLLMSPMLRCNRRVQLKRLEHFMTNLSPFFRNYKSNFYYIEVLGMSKHKRAIEMLAILYQSDSTLATPYRIMLMADKHKRKLNHTTTFKR